MTDDHVVLIEGKYRRKSFGDIFDLISAYPFYILASELPDIEWLHSNMEGEYLGVFYEPPRWTVFYFMKEEDAFLFKLKYY